MTRSITENINFALEALDDLTDQQEKRLAEVTKMLVEEREKTKALTEALEDRTKRNLPQLDYLTRHESVVISTVLEVLTKTKKLNDEMNRIINVFWSQLDMLNQEEYRSFYACSGSKVTKNTLLAEHQQLINDRLSHYSVNKPKFGKCLQSTKEQATTINELIKELQNVKENFKSN